MFSAAELKELFPQTQNNLVYLDSAATSLKFGPMVDKIYEFERTAVSNVHRGVHKLSGQATDGYEESRNVISKFLNASPDEIIFTTGTTDAINLVATHFEQILKEGDVVVLSEMEHHANLLPWQRLSQQKGIELKFISIDSNGDLNIEDLERFIQEGGVKVVSLCHASNTLGTVNPVDQISSLCQKHDIYFGLDGAQSVTFSRIDLKKMNVDFFCFSAHKIFGPFGLGILYLSKELIGKFDPIKLGGGIITDVEYKNHGLLDGPIKFEPGTPNITAVIFFTEVIKFMDSLNFKEILDHDQELLTQARSGLESLGGFQEIGTSKTRANILSFNFEGIHANDLCELLDQQDIALRSGHHCTQPLFKKLSLSGSARASFSIYNTEKEVERFIQACKKSLEILR